ncbi:MAG: AMP-binding protein, partial [Rhodospirillales bacterium]|nr:AMP-binding protein [Rhodospirillales bacterium]
MTIAHPTSSNSVNLLRDANLRNWLDRGASAHPNKFFLNSIDQKKTATYGEVHEFCRRLSRWLREQGFDANDRVALISNNALEHLLFYFGVMYYGATICTIHVGI